MHRTDTRCDFRREVSCRYARKVRLVLSTLWVADSLSVASDMVFEVGRCNPPVTDGP
jgi:hypothetical protein